MPPAFRRRFPVFSIGELHQVRLVPLKIGVVVCVDQHATQQKGTVDR